MHKWTDLFFLVLYNPVNNFSVMSRRVILGLTSTEQRIKCLAQGHNAVPLVGLKPQHFNLKSSPLPLSHLAPHMCTENLTILLILNGMFRHQKRCTAFSQSSTIHVLFGLILYVPVNNFSVMLGWIFLG